MVEGCDHIGTCFLGGGEMIGPFTFDIMLQETLLIFHKI